MNLKLTSLFTVIVLMSCQLFSQTSSPWDNLPEDVKNTNVFKRAQWFYNQRAYPNETIPFTKYHNELRKEAKRIRTSH